MNIFLFLAFASTQASHGLNCPVTVAFISFAVLQLIQIVDDHMKFALSFLVMVILIELLLENFQLSNNIIIKDNKLHFFVAILK